MDDTNLWYYREGVKRGFHEFAVWKNGEQYCGVLNHPLKECMQWVNEGQYDHFIKGQEEPEPPEDNMTDAEADADTLRSAGMGTDEDYGRYADDPPEYGTNHLGTEGNFSDG